MTKCLGQSARDLPTANDKADLLPQKSAWLRPGGLSMRGCQDHANCACGCPGARFVRNHLRQPLIWLRFARRSRAKGTARIGEDVCHATRTPSRPEAMFPPGVQIAGDSFAVFSLRAYASKRGCVWRCMAAADVLVPFVLCSCTASMPSDPAVLLPG